MLQKSRKGLKAVAGFHAGGAVGGIKASGKPDVAVIYTDEPVVVASTFTRNAAAAAPVLLSRKHMRAATHRALVINSGNANCCTGDAGMADAQEMADLVAAELGCTAKEVLVCSTGVIGVPLPMDAVRTGIKVAIHQPTHSAADAILTTDLVSKSVAYTHADGYSLAGICKGSGMIHPNMATMLGMVLTDVSIDKKELQAITRRAVAKSFNSISVDNDESTNDTCCVFASGASGITVKSAAARARFEESLTQVLQELAQKIVRDGEGATSFIETQVTGAKNDKQADALAAAVCDSMLVKTAFAGRDPNWGRIVAAAGYSGISFSLEKLTVTLNGVLIFSEGCGHDDLKRPFTKNGRRVSRERLAASMNKGDQHLCLTLTQGQGTATRWTSDLTHGYITINADYTT